MAISTQKKKTCCFRISWLCHIIKPEGWLIVSLYSTVYATEYTIDTTQAQIRENSALFKSGIIENRNFHGPNNGVWNYSVATFNLQAGEAQSVFSSGNVVKIYGAHALSVSVNGSFTVATTLDVSGKEVNFTADGKRLFWLGGFVRVNKSCCILGKLGKKYTAINNE